MPYKILTTTAFSTEFRKYEKNEEFIHALEAKRKRLEQDPANVGGMLSGRLHGFRATRLLKKFRIVFRIDEQEQIVFLEAIDHRKHGYNDF